MKPALISTSMRYFLAVARTGSVSKAAEELHVAGSAISRQLSRLEDDLQLALFERRQYGMRLTPAGAQLAARLTEAQQLAQQALDEAMGDADQQQRDVRLACTEGFAAGVMPRAMQQFRARFPQARMLLLVLDPDEVSRQLQQGAVDLALKYVVRPERGVVVHHRASSDLLAVMQPDHPLSSQRRVRLEQVVSYPLVLGAPGTTARHLFDLACAAHGLRYDVAAASNVSAALLPWVGEHDVLLAGAWSAAPRLRDGSLVARPFVRGHVAARSLHLMSAQGRGLSQAAQGMLEVLLQVLTQGPIDTEQQT